MANDSAAQRASRSAVRPETLFRRGASPGGQTTGASGMDLLLHHAGKEGNMRTPVGDCAERRRHRPDQVWDYFTDQTSYKRFRRRIIARGCGEAPSASTPMDARWQCELSFEFDTVRQRLELDSPPRGHRGHGNPPELAEGITPFTPPDTSCSSWGGLCAQNVPEQRWVWRAAGRGHSNSELAASEERRCDFEPFAVMDKTCSEVQGKPAMTFVVPSLLDDYYTSLLDCSCNGMVALALGSSVYLWNSQTRSLAGHLEQTAPSGQPSDRWSQSISCLCWSGDGRTLCIGTRRREIQLWDVELKKTVRPLPSHLSVVGALSWNQHLVSSGSVLGRIHHLDPRAPAPLIGAAFQRGGLCSLQWSPDGGRLASGSPEGLLSVWDGGVTGCTGCRRPLATMEQPTAVKAMGWCPWQRNVIATGGGWKDGQLRIWDTESRTCVIAASTNSQVCSLRWAERKRHLITGHGLPRHHVTCWAWDSPSLCPTHKLTGHSQRVLHLALNRENTEMYSAGADRQFRIWDL